MGPEHALIENLTYDELQIHQRAQMQRTLTLRDIQAFALVSGDVNPAHVDAAYAEGTRFHGVIAHGMFAGALISSVLGTEFPGPGTIYIEQGLRFHRPVHLGDTLTISVTVASKDDATRNVRLDCAVLNQHGDMVVSGQALVRAPTQKVTRPRASLPTMHLFEPEARLKAWIASVAAATATPLSCAVVHPCDQDALRGALLAASIGLISPRLIGPEARIRRLADAAGLPLDTAWIVDAPHSHAAAAAAVEMAARGEVAMLMKGSLSTDELMQAVQAEHRLHTGRAMSHVYRFEIPAYVKPLLVTDAALHVRPDLTDKADIVRNAIELAHALGIAQPRVALLSAMETVSPKLGATVDAAALCKMADRGQIEGGVLDGPLGFDHAVSADAARTRGIVSPVAGQADILVVPDLEAGNMLARQLEYLAGASSCGAVLGARVPIALAVRGQSATAHQACAALAGMVVRAGVSRAHPSS